jgi:hypothetical protein
MASSAHTGHLAAPRRPAVADRLFRVTTALAVDRPLPGSAI